MSGLEVSLIDFAQLPQKEREKVLYENQLETIRRQKKSEMMDIIQLAWMAVLTVAVGAQKFLEVFRWP